MTDPTMRKCHVEPIARIRHIYILSRPRPFSQTQSATPSLFHLYPRASERVTACLRQSSIVRSLVSACVGRNVPKMLGIARPCWTWQRGGRKPPRW
jgi:hypothetical protein